MKSIKILGITVATLGVAASVGGAIALYTKAAQDVGFGIGAGDYHGSTGVVTYKVNNATSGTVKPTYYDGEHAEVDGLQAQVGAAVVYSFPLSASFANDLAQQSYVMGKVTASIGTVPDALLGKYKVSVYIDGYTKNWAEESFKELNYDYVFTNEAKTYSGSKTISVATAGGQSLVVYFEITDATGLDTLTLNELQLPSVSMTWGEKAEDYGVAYVVGKGNQWTKDDQYSMAVDITADSYTWIYNNLSGSLDEAKCTHDNGSWSNPSGNVKLDADKTYTVKWSGVNDTDASFEAQA